MGGVLSCFDSGESLPPICDGARFSYAAVRLASVKQAGVREHCR